MRLVDDAHAINQPVKASMRQSEQPTVVNQNMEGEAFVLERRNKLSHRFQWGQVQVDKLNCQQKEKTREHRFYRAWWYIQR